MSDNKANILLVEDDQNLGFVVQDALKRKGYTVHLCRDGKEGLKLCGRTACSLFWDMNGERNKGKRANGR